MSNTKGARSRFDRVGSSALVSASALLILSSSVSLAAGAGMPTLTPVTPSKTQVSAGSGATCAGQLTNYINSQNTQALNYQKQGLDAAYAGLGTQFGGLVAEGIAAASDISDLEIPGIAADAGGVTATAAGVVTQTQGIQEKLDRPARRSVLALEFHREAARRP